MPQIQHWGHRLSRLLIENKMTQSDLARKVWNEERADARGYTHVVGKDRVSAYVNRGVVPEMWIIEKIAKIFDTEPEKLCPEAFTEKPTRQVMRFDAFVGSEEGLLTVNRIVSREVAMKVLQILSRHDTA